MKIFLIILIVIVVLFLALMYFLSSFTLGIRPQTLEEAKAWQEDHYDLSWYDDAEKEDYTVTSFDGYEIHCQLLPAPVTPKEAGEAASGPVPESESDAYAQWPSIQPDADIDSAWPAPGAVSGDYIIISHGYTDNRFGALKYAKIYRDLGFNIVIYDLRGHGLNEPTFCTYSIRESQDLKAIIDDLRERHPEMSRLGIHGESLGAATTAAVLKYDQDLDFAVCDCPFSDIEGVLKGGVRAMHLPAFLVDLASVADKIRYGYAIKDMRPIDCLKDNEVPILFIHGDADELIPPHNSEALAEASSGYTEVHLIPGAPHAQSVLTDPEKYQEIVKAYLQKINVINADW